MLGDEVHKQLAEILEGVEATGAVEEARCALVQDDLAEAADLGGIQVVGMAGGKMAELLYVALVEVATVLALHAGWYACNKKDSSHCYMALLFI